MPHTGQALPLSIEAYSEETTIAQPPKCVPLAAAPTSVSHFAEILAWSGERRAIRWYLWGGRGLNPRPRDYESPALTG